MRERLPTFKDVVWGPFIKWRRRIGVIALVAGVISAIVTILLMVVITTTEEKMTFDYTILLGLFFFWLWLSFTLTFHGVHFSGLMDLARSLFRERQGG